MFLLLFHVKFVTYHLVSLINSGQKLAEMETTEVLGKGLEVVYSI